MSSQNDGWNTAAGQRVRRRAFKRDKEANAECWICKGEKGPIDYSVRPSSTDLSYEPDHYLPRARYPHLALDLANIRAAHRCCNRSRQDKAVIDSLGNTSGSWRRG